MGVCTEGVEGAIADFACFRAPSSRPQTRNPLQQHKFPYKRHNYSSSRNLGEKQLGGASADAQSYWQGRFAACAFVERVWHTGRPRNSWGVAPNPTRELRPLTPQGGILRLSYQVQHRAKKGKTLRALCVRMKLPHTN